MMSSTDSLLFNPLFLDFLKQYFIYKKGEILSEDKVMEDMPAMYKHNEMVKGGVQYLYRTDMLSHCGNNTDTVSDLALKQLSDLRTKEGLEITYIQSAVDTNRNIRRSNRAIVGASISTGLFALAAFVISLLGFINSEKLKPELSGLNITLQSQEQRQQLIVSSLREIGHSIQNVADSIPK